MVFSAPQNAYRGGTIGGGFFGLYKQGVIAGNMLIGHLNGDIDIAATSIYESDEFAFAVNLDAADLQDVEISQKLLDGAAYIVENGETAQGVTLQWPEVDITLPDMSLEERRAADLAVPRRAAMQSGDDRRAAGGFGCPFLKHLAVTRCTRLQCITDLSESLLCGSFDE